ncbi:RHS repeat-associated core domain-containing protein [Pseudomonas sp. xss_4]|uniref:RHS repeat-associated core domain-containing protein n=1 Tax=Pseudomonas sp. xss_4 TaxID=3367216 RepID=UPI003709DAA9
MASSAGAHSNATNFQSFVQNQVDQRTGQYNLAIDLRMPAGNDLTGPNLPLRLSYSPFNTQDSGFGIGWQLALTQYDPATQMLTMHTGESYKVTGSGPQPAMREKKIHSFHFYDDGENGSYRVEHKSGLVEILTLHDVLNPIALPSKVRAPSGHGITLSYVPENRRLEKIVDDYGAQLLALKYTDGRVTIDTHPGAGAEGLPFMRYMLELKNRVLVEVKLPPEVGGNWRFGYTTARGLTCLAKVSAPSGTVEEIRYGENDDPGHLLPGTNPQRAWPRVTSHEVKPRADQPPMRTTYTYEHFDEENSIEVAHSFVGSNSGISWRDDGEDNLYRAQSSYRYSVTAHYWKAGKVARKQTQTFNRYHLMTKQTLEQDGHIEETETVFHERPGIGFDDQPRYFQLPKTITKRWKLRDDASKLHLETAITHFDDYGNVTEEQAPTGVRTTYEYYDKEGEKDGDTWACPPDPQGFVRNLKCKTVYPVPNMPNDAPVQRTRLTYKAFPALASLGQASQWLAPCEEQVLQVFNPSQPDEREQLLLKVERGYLNLPDNAFLHGRPDYQVTTRYGDDSTDTVRRAIESRSSRIEWGYRKVVDDVYGLEYWTDETVLGFDLVQKTTSMAVSSLHGQNVYEEDDTGNSIRRRYDALARVVEETLAPGQGMEESKQRYEYGLVNHPEEGAAGLATQSVTSSTGVITVLTFDGCSRMVTEEREAEVAQDPDTAAGDEKPRKRERVAQRNYDELGQLKDETSFDYFDDKTLTLQTTFEYDAWGKLCKTTLPHGVTQHSEFSPFGEAGDIVTQWVETPGNPGVRQQQQVTESNGFDKPAAHYRLDDAGNIVGRRDFSYDGLGRCTLEEHTFKRNDKPVSRISKYTYDSEGRVTRSERPDQSAVLSRFALHSAAPLAEQLLVERRKDLEPTLAWQRDYDGLERLKSLTAGKQKETYNYKRNTSLVETRTTAQRTFTYHYRPARSAQPSQIDVNTAKRATFDYDARTSSISSASDAQGTHSYTYTDQGYLLRTQWVGEGAIGHHCDYRSSFQGMQLGYRESDGVQVDHTYNDLGQLEKTCQGDLVAQFEYDALGRLWKTTTKDLSNTQVLVCLQTYDELGREINREQTLTRHDGTTLSQSIALTWQEDDQLRSRTLTRDGKQLLLETFDYDTLDRLEQHNCQGTALPQNGAGRFIKNQFFVYDELNNLTECYTDFADGTSDEAFYTYDGFILKQAEHSLQPDYPASQAFEHDAEGNLLNDEQGNKLVYDDRGRLQEVQRSSDGLPLYRYRYDGHNDLIGVRHEQAAEVTRRYQGYRLTSTRDADLLTEYLYAGERPLGLQRPASTADNRLFMTDAANSVIGECSKDELHANTYSAYGDSPDNAPLVGLLGFNGEVRERALGWSLLGRGYRAYNPGLMRFHSPDSASPENAGINPYVYCGGNPVNWYDPSGHYGMRNSTEYPYVPPVAQPKPKADWRSWLGVALGAVFAVVSFMLLPPVGLTMAFSLGAASLAIDVAGTVVSVVGLVTMNETANDWAFGLGIASALSTLGIIGYSRLAAKGAGKAASIGTQTDSAASLSGPRVIAREGDVFFGRRFGTAPGRLWRKVTTPFNNNISTQTVATGIGVDAGTQMAPTTFAEAATSMTPQHSIRSTASTASTASTGSGNSIGSYQLENLFTEPAQVVPPAPTRDWSGSAIGAMKEGTLHWPSRTKYSYVPPKNPKFN